MIPKKFQSKSARLMAINLALIGVITLASSHVHSAPSQQTQAATCKRELENANKTISKWANTMESLVNESQLPKANREAIYNEANQILDMIEDFGQKINKRSPAELSKDLVTIRRRSNRMALDIYLSTFDMRWPQNSLQLGIIVERAQQACLDRATIQALETAENPLPDLLMQTDKQNEQDQSNDAVVESDDAAKKKLAGPA